MEETARIIALAGLLQDIGTICRRAGCPNKQSRNILAACLPAGQPYEALSQCIGCHHQAIGVKYIRQNDHIAYLVYTAAKIAAGACCRSAAEESAFFRGVAYNSQYPQLWRTLQSILRQTDFLTCTVNQVEAMLKSVAAGIPYSTAAGSNGEFSLYDHSRLTAALAVCLYRYFNAAGISDYRSCCAGHKKYQCRTIPAFLLVVGELNGKQDGVSAVPAAGSCLPRQGCAAFSEILPENCLEKWLSMVGLSRAHVLSTAGSRFYLLVPNIAEVVNLLETANRAGNDWAWQEVSADALLEYQLAGKLSHVLIPSASMADAKLNAAYYGNIGLKNEDAKHSSGHQGTRKSGA